MGDAQKVQGGPTSTESVLLIWWLTDGRSGRARRELLGLIWFCFGLQVGGATGGKLATSCCYCRSCFVTQRTQRLGALIDLVGGWARQ